ncbi:hypothetical protein [Glycomyces salinus]|uniref:hypothetical protein n=1 Tax=Glycomyces salinus TaxID=980294 RepID=UPI0018EAC202|nr:hypothetical protein [Glycomyces salinus]
MSTLLKTALLCVAIAAFWIGVVLYSRHTYTQDACRACDGTGRDWEPSWMALMRLSTHRRWRNCRKCGGSPVYDIHQH